MLSHELTHNRQHLWQFGAQIGASFGNARTIDKARMEEMRRKGITPEMLEMANEVGVALKQTTEGLRATQDSVETQQRLAKALDKQSESIYERAKSAIEKGDEEQARRLLMERETIKDKLLKVLKTLAEDRKRLAVMETNVEALEARGLEIESLLRRSVGASALKDSVGSGFALEPEDPLLQKFRDLGM
jgi:phage shock protein A